MRWRRTNWGGYTSSGTTLENVRQPRVFNEIDRRVRNIVPVIVLARKGVLGVAASRPQSRTRKFEQVDKWSFCLTTAMIAANRRDHEQATIPVHGT
jgi:hypothetical protein